METILIPIHNEKSALDKGAIIKSILLFLLAILPFYPSILFEFTLDDQIHILDNNSSKGILNIFNIFFEPLFPGNLYRPIPILSYALTYTIFGANPIPYHLTNLLLHGIVTVLIYILLRQFLSDRISLLTAGIFGIHPIHTEVIANVSGRSELFAHLFGLTALYLLIKKYKDNLYPNKLEEKKISLLVGSLFLLSLLSKESGVSFLLLIPLTIYLVFPDDWRRICRPLVTILISSFLLYIGLRYIALGSAIFTSQEIAFVDNPLASLSIAPRIIYAIILLGRYLELSVAPTTLSADYSYAHTIPSSLADGIHGVASIILVLSLLYIAITGMKKREALSFCVAWFFCSFVVTSNIVFPIGTIFAERLAYLPSIGILCLVAAIIMSFKPIMLGRLIILSYLLLLGTKSFSQCLVWRDNTSLFTYQIRTSPRSVRTLVNYAVVLRNQKKFDEALIRLDQAMDLAPNLADPPYIKGSIYAVQGRLPEAERWLLTAKTIDPTNPAILNTLGRLYITLGKLSVAERQFNTVLSLQPENYNGLIGLLAVRINEGKLDEANELVRKIRRIDSSNPEFNALQAVVQKMVEGKGG